MKTTLLASISLIAASMVVATSAHATEKRWPNWYVGLHGGSNWVSDSEYSSGLGSVDIESDNGYLLGASLGYAPASDITFFNQSRWELEYTYRNNDVDSIGGLFASGSTYVNSFMGNFIFDFSNQSKFTPYLGAGAGIAHIETEDTASGDEDTVFAWQLLAGLDYAPDMLPNTVWGLGYRYFNADDAEYEFTGVNFEREYEAHSVEAKARFRF